MLRRVAPLLLVTLCVACAESGTLLNPDVALVNDLGADADDAPDVVDVRDFEAPRFDVPARRRHRRGERHHRRDRCHRCDRRLGRERRRDVAPPRVDHCYLLDPRALDAVPGGATAAVGVAVFAAGVTAGAGRGEWLTVEARRGPRRLDAPRDPDRVDVGPIAYDRDIDGRGATGSRDYDRYQGSLTAPTAADEYAFAARARLGTGPWTACDFVQTTPHAYQPAWAGRLTVAAASARRVGFCNLQYPRTLSLAASATATAPVYGRVYAAGVTDRGCASTPTSAELSAQWGYGLEGTLPAGATWTWLDGAYEGHRDSTMPLGTGNCQHVEYRATPRAPVDCSMRSYGWRYRLGSGPWTYCRWAPPAEGAPTTPAFDVWEPSLAGAMTVTGCL